VEEPIESQIEEPETKSAHSTPSIFRIATLVAGLSMLSKVAGLVRDIVVAAAYGTSLIADAFNFVFQFTGNILVLFGGLGGPFHSSTVAVLTPRKDDPGRGQLMAQIALVTFLALSVLALILYAAAPHLAEFGANKYDPHWLKSGTAVTQQAVNNLNGMFNLNLQLNDPIPAGITDKVKLVYMQQTTDMIRIMSPLVVIAGLIGISYGILNVYHKVFWPSLSPAIASLAIIIAIALTNDTSRLTYGIPLAIGTLAGGIGQFLAQVPGLISLKLKATFKWQPDPALGSYSAMLWPALFATSMGELMALVDAYFAFPEFVGETGALTAVVTANRLVQLPLGILVTAMVVPILPRFTQQVADNNLDALRGELRRALRFLWFLGLPLMAILLVVPRPIIALLFQRGHFTAESTHLVTTALVFLVPMIFFYLARDLFVRVFFAFQDSTTPYRVALMALFTKAALDWFLVVQLKMGVAGLSLASTLITIFNLTLLSYFLRKRVPNIGISRLLQPIFIMTAASILCGGITLFTYNMTHDQLLSGVNVAETVRLFISLAIAGLSGLALYVLTCLLFKLEEPRMVAVRLPIIKRFVK